MGANYSHTQRGAITLTPEIYNADHQNHIDNSIPALFDDYSATVAQMALMTNPGGVGTESLATTLAGELERLRYMIAALHGKDDWYERPANPIGGGASEHFSLAGLSGFSITDIPSGTKRVTLNLQDLTPDSSAVTLILELGTSAGIVSTGYRGILVDRYSGSESMLDQPATHFTISRQVSGISFMNGRVDLVLGNDNTWGIEGVVASSSALVLSHSAGRAILGAELDRVQIRITSALSPVFSSGYINIIHD